MTPRERNSRQVERLEWDSAFFGFPIGRVRDKVTPRDIARALYEADELGLRCVYLLAAINDHSLIDSAQEHGFIVSDVRMELERPVKGHPAAMTGLRPGRSADMSWLTPIARERFGDSRFFADKRFPDERSREFYVEWLRRGFTAGSSRVTLVTKDCLGFVVCRFEPSSDTGAIELIGVTGDAAGHGLGGKLVAGAGALFLGASMLTAKVVTQGSNIPAQRLYQASGYRTAGVFLWLHRWSEATPGFQRGPTAERPPPSISSR